jgi:hypothetical protein
VIVADDIADVLAEEAEAFEEAKDASPTGRRVRSRRRAEDPSQVYSIRIPVARLEQLRRLAESRGMTPTALARLWVLQRLDQEFGGPLAEDGDTDEVVLKLRRHGHRWEVAESPPGSAVTG